MTPQELDHWAAEKVMGWNILVRDYPRPGHPWLYRVDGTEVMALYKWTPSDPSQLWLVIEKIRELGWYLSLDCIVNGFAARFYPSEANMPEFIKTGAIDWKPPTIINNEPCIAILKAARAALK